MMRITKFKQHIQNGFSKRLFISYMAIFLAAFMLFSGVVYVGMAAMLKNRIIETSEETLRQATLNIKQYMDDVEQLMFNVAVNATVQNILTNTQGKTDFEAVRDLEDLAEQMLSVDVFIQRTNGVCLFAELQSSFPAFTPYTMRRTTGRSGKSAICRADEVRSEAWYQNVIHERGIPVWEAMIENGEIRFTGSRALLNTQDLSQIIGVVQVLAGYEQFADILQEISFGADGAACMVADDTVLWGDKTELENELTAAQLHADSTDAVWQTIGGARCCILRCDVGKNGWQLIGIIPERTMLVQFDVVKSALLPALALALLLSLLLVLYNARRQSQPIRQVAEAMRHFDSDRDRRFSTTRTDEIGILCMSFNRMMDHIDKLLHEVQETSSKKRKAELQALQAQINPHFLYNTLDCIKSIACVDGNQDIVQLTTALSEFFRISLNRGAEILSLRRELDHVRSYCAIQKFRSSTAFELSFDVPEELLEQTVIKLILQPVVENSIVHGFRQKKSTGHIQISARAEGRYLHIWVCDDGTGADIEYLNGLLHGEYKTAPGKSNAYGIINVDERLRLTFDGQSGLHYEENPSGGVTAEIIVEEPLGNEETDDG